MVVALLEPEQHVDSLYMFVFMCTCVCVCVCVCGALCSTHNIVQQTSKPQTMAAESEAILSFTSFLYLANRHTQVHHWWFVRFHVIDDFIHNIRWRQELEMRRARQTTFGKDQTERRKKTTVKVSAWLVARFVNGQK